MLKLIEDWQEIPKTPEILLIDDFYDNTDWVIPCLENQIPFERHDVNYAGMAYPLPDDMKRYALARISKILEVKGLETEINEGELRLVLESNQNGYRTFVHADPSLNVLIYLSGVEGEERGTRFYQHKELGMSFVHSDHPQQKKMNLLLESYDTNDSSKWDMIKEIPFKKNRAIIFNGHYFHSMPEKFYGKTLADGRITQNFFFKNLEKYYLKGTGL